MLPSSFGKSSIRTLFSTLRKNIVGQVSVFLPCPIFLSITCRYFPFGIVFLVAGKILEMDDPSAMGKKLGFYAITVVMGLVLHGLFILPAMYFFITKKSPIVYIRGILQALLISLATSSR